MRPASCLMLLLISLLFLSPALGGTASIGQLYVLLSPSNDPGPSAVVAFDVDGQGRLHQAATYETGGDGRASLSPQGLIVDRMRRLLLAVNNAGSSIAVFRIESDGSLTAVDGSPFPTDAEPAFVAVQPGGNRLFVSHRGSIQTFEIGRGGRLVPATSIDGIAPRELKVDGRGRFLFVADMADGMRAYRITDTGDLMEFAGSPFRVSGDPSAGRPFYLDLAQGRRVLVLDIDEGVSVWNVNKLGSVNGVADSPFAIGEFAGPLTVTPNGTFAYVSVPFGTETYGFRISFDGSLIPLPGSPYDGDYGTVALIAPTRTGRLYEVAQEGPGINLFTMEPDGDIVWTESFPISDLEDRLPNGAVYVSDRWPGRPTGPELPHAKP